MTQFLKEEEEERKGGGGGEKSARVRQGHNLPDRYPPPCLRQDRQTEAQTLEEKVVMRRALPWEVRPSPRQLVSERKRGERNLMPPYQDKTRPDHDHDKSKDRIGQDRIYHAMELGVDWGRAVMHAHGGRASQH